MEIWKSLKYPFDFYEVSNLGSVRNVSDNPRWGNGKKLANHNTGNGYQQTCLTSREDGTLWRPLIHRLVAEIFIGPIPDKYQINHKNGIRNDNRVENLEIVTCSENNLHAYRTLKRESAKGEKHPMSKYSEEMIQEIRWLFAMGARQFQLVKEYCVDPTVIRDIVHRKRWNHI